MIADPRTQRVQVSWDSVPPGMDLGSQTAWIRALAADAAPALGLRYDPTSVAIQSRPELRVWEVSWLAPVQTAERFADALRQHREDVAAAAALMPDPLTVPESYGSVARPDAWDLLDGAVVGSALWAGALALVITALAAVLVAIGLRRICRG